MRNFDLGTVVHTRSVYDACQNNKEVENEVMQAFKKYIACEWGDLEEEDKLLNDMAIKNNDDRILAKYHIKSLDRDIYIITEWDRSVTTILFCEEY